MQRKIFDNDGHAYFITFSCYHRRKLLSHDRAKRIVLHFLSAQLENQKGICAGFVIMPDHVHAIVYFEETGRLSSFMNQWKRRSSIQIKNLYRTFFIAYSNKINPADPVWQAKYYSFNIRSEVKVKEKLKYMHNNPVKSGLVSCIEDWKFSSARFYNFKKPVGVMITPLF